MAIGYEEALETLQAMFGPPWTRETLDAVLRHHQGHMENTVESILAHGDGDPQALIDKLKAPLDTKADAELARQLAQEQGERAPAPRTSTTQQKKGRGTPTNLPSDFLRIPGTQQPATSTSASTLDEDEALARMLQDELFSQELANNPEFAHLARPRMVGGRPTSVRADGRRVGGLPARGTARASRPGEGGPDVVQNLKDLGENTKKRLQSFAAQFNAKMHQQNINNPNAAAAAESGAVAERRGLLDDADDEGEMMEMSFGGKKTL